MMKQWKCQICGQIVESDERPDKGPLCKAPGEKFNEVVEDSRSYATEHEVGIIDGGECDAHHSPATVGILRDILKKSEGADTLILGCTHFSSLKGLCRKIGREYGIRHIVDSARVGASLIPRAAGDGGTDYIIKTG